MFLYLKEYGYKVSKRKNFLVIEHANGEKEQYPIQFIEAVYFAGECRISKAILIELTERNIDTILLSRTGKPLTYIFPAWVKPRIWKLWEKQLNLNKNKKAKLVRSIVLNAIKAKADVLSELARSRKRTNKVIAEKLIKYRNRIRGIERKIRKTKLKDYRKLRQLLMGLEGFSARLYFEALKFVIPETFGYNGRRTRRPPKDLFNAAISFGYAYLKYFVEKGFLIRGINPYYGILHEETDKIKPFLTFDMMEGFRHWFIDKAIITLIARKVLDVEKHSSERSGGIYLNKRGVNIVSKKLHEERIKKFNKRIYREINKFLILMTKQAS